MPFTERDRYIIARAGLHMAEAEGQLDHLVRGSAPSQVIRPCTLNDGIFATTPERREALAAYFNECLNALSIGRFVPASGAASRMFAMLLDEAPGSEAITEFWRHFAAFPFAEEIEMRLLESGDTLAAALERGDQEAILSLMLSDDELGYMKRPKGSVPFHAYHDEVRTAFMEHIVEADLLGKANASVALHFTVPVDYSETERNAIEAFSHERTSERVSLSFSVQAPHTDTLALEEDDQPAREAGDLVLRPGGHGALLYNLSHFSHDLVFIRNIDNVVPDRLKPAVVENDHVLGGLTLELLNRRNALLKNLRENHSNAVEETRVFLNHWVFNGALTPLLAADELIQLLDRPLRVCGMVKNEGEPGGGPFWMNTGSIAPTVQIVESSQIDRSIDAQHVMLKNSTHFNPVNIVCAMRNPDGHMYDLGAFSNPNRGIIAHKPFNGRVIKVLERPGLWNGGMEQWLSVFVEVPGNTFAPVKTVIDLLRPAHRV